MPSLGERLKNSWDAFRGRDAPPKEGYGVGYYRRPDRPQLTPKNSRSIVASVYNQIAVDVASIDLKHVIVDQNDRYKATVDDPLNRCLTRSANIDQTGRQLIQDAVMSMFDEGYVAIVPVSTNINPNLNDVFKIYELRVGKILQWYPDYVLVEVYDGTNGQMKQIMCSKSSTAIIENPFYNIMNESNALAKRYVTVLNQLDRTNEQNSAGKIDLLVQVPYSIRTKGKQDLAESRRKDLEVQLTNSQYGIGYIDASERVIQLNRSVENNLWTQAKDLQEQFFNQLGFSPTIFDGSADEKTMLNYNNRTLEPILTRLVEEMTRKWLSPTAITQGHTIKYFRNPFKLVPVGQMADIADKFTRNEIMTSNEMRAVIGMLPSEDPKADMLRNSNLNHPDEAQLSGVNPVEQEGVQDDVEPSTSSGASIEDQLKELGVNMD